MNILNIVAAVLLLLSVFFICLSIYYSREPRGLLLTLKGSVAEKTGMALLSEKTQCELPVTDVIVVTKDRLYENPLYFSFTAPFSFQTIHARKLICDILRIGSPYGNSFMLKSEEEHNPSVSSLEVRQRKFQSCTYRITVYLLHERLPRFELGGKRRTIVTVAVAYRKR